MQGALQAVFTAFKVVDDSETKISDPSNPSQSLIKAIFFPEACKFSTETTSLQTWKCCQRILHWKKITFVSQLWLWLYIKKWLATSGCITWWYCWLLLLWHWSGWNQLLLLSSKWWHSGSKRWQTVCLIKDPRGNWILNNFLSIKCKHKINIYACKQPEDGSEMITSDNPGCNNEYYHTNGLKITAGKWYCPNYRILPEFKRSIWYMFSYSAMVIIVTLIAYLLHSSKCILTYLFNAFLVNT